VRERESNQAPDAFCFFALGGKIKLGFTKPPLLGFCLHACLLACLLSKEDSDEKKAKQKYPKV
jgi:hypothetical protein